MPVVEKGLFEVIGWRHCLCVTAAGRLAPANLGRQLFVTCAHWHDACNTCEEMGSYSAARHLQLSDSRLLVSFFF